ncbi:MAG: hypothetical protein NZ918_04185 [Aigarchaeota archaeon]|nr:hypothetical protein [Aigarchaeota archaeon]MDW8021252.1 hypothetical protein [Nitrososphaerota archaeon]
MKDVFEIAYRYVMPAIRGLVVREIHKYGIRESIIANILGISRSAVTRYIMGERGGYINLVKFNEVIPMIRELSKNIIEKQLMPQEIHLMMFKIAAHLMSRKKLCGLHKRIDQSIDIVKCEICPTIFKEITPS